MTLDKVYAYGRGGLILFILLLALSSSSLSAPGLDLITSCNTRTAYYGDTVIYTYTLGNNGTEALSDLALLDDYFGDIALNKSALDVGESCTVTLPHMIAEKDIPGPLINRARGFAKCEGKDVFSNNATFMVNLGIRGIENVTKFQEMLYNKSNNSS